MRIKIGRALKSSPTHQCLRLLVTFDVDLAWAKISSSVDYNALGLILFSHAARKNDMNRASRLRSEKVIYMRQVSDPGYKTILQPKQMSVNLQQYIICTVRNPGHLFLGADGE